MQPSSYLVALTDQAGGRIDVHDLAQGALNEGSLVWSQSYGHKSVAGVKLRRYQGKRVLLACFGKSFANMVEVDSHRVLWQSQTTGINPHSAELIPVEGGRYLIAVAATVSQNVRFFDAAGPGAPSLGEVAAKDAHGVLFDPQEQVLWILGEDLLSKNRVSWSEGGVQVSCLAQYRAPTGHGHDLAPVYGNPHRLWVTTHPTVYQFDKRLGRFLTDYPAYPVLNSPGRNDQVKGIGNFPDGTCVKIYPDGCLHPWTSATVYLIKPGPHGGWQRQSLSSPTEHYYKLRVFCPDYY